MEIGLMFFFNSVIWLSIGYASLCVIRAVFAATGRDNDNFTNRRRNQDELFPAFKNDLIARLKAAPVVLLAVMSVFGVRPSVPHVQVVFHGRRCDTEGHVQEGEMKWVAKHLDSNLFGFRLMNTSPL